MEGNHLDKIGTPWQQREAGDVQHVCVQGGCVQACVLGGAPEFETWVSARLQRVSVLELPSVREGKTVCDFSSLL